VIKAGDGLGIHTSEPFDHAVITHNLFIGGKPPVATYGGYSTGRGRAVDVQYFGENCIIDHNAYAVIGMPFEGKIRTRTFTKLPGTDFEKYGRVLKVESPFPDDPSRAYEPTDLSALTDAGAYAGEKVPVYGPRP
jgi:hypothetical protein